MTVSGMLKLLPFSQGLLQVSLPSYAKGVPDWALWEGTDLRWHDLAEVDLSRIIVVTCLREGEGYVDGGVHEERLAAEYSGMIRVGFTLPLALRMDPDKFPAEWFYLDLHCSQHLRDPNGERCTPSFRRTPAGHSPLLMGTRPLKEARSRESRTLLLRP
jgi:hypothetical protein